MDHEPVTLVRRLETADGDWPCDRCGALHRISETVLVTYLSEGGRRAARLCPDCADVLELVPDAPS